MNSFANAWAMSCPPYLAFTTIILTSCTSYVWNPINQSEFDDTLNQQVGKNYSQTYPRSDQNNFFGENDTYLEYIQDKYNDCSWIIKVEKKSSRIESWRYSYPARCRKK